jgi:hypothetical protein
MAGGIYVLQESGELVEMREHRYDSEDLLQALLARYPSLLAGDQMDPTSPRRWVLVRREAELPSEEGGPDRWSVDHLFLDQDAVPTIVEVKRSSDTRIRREVVGQMLDYAANAVVYWPVERLRAMFEATYGEQADRVLAALLGEVADQDPEEFWKRAKINLQAGRIGGAAYIIRERGRSHSAMGFLCSGRHKVGRAPLDLPRHFRCQSCYRPGSHS